MHSHLAGLLGGGMANSKSKSYKKMKMQAKGFGRAKATSSSDKELTGPKQKNCAWQVRAASRGWMNGWMGGWMDEWIGGPSAPPVCCPPH